MANKLISEIGLPKSIANVFAARNITTVKDALSLTEFELLELLDVDLAEVKSAISQISSVVSPPYQTALLLLEQRLHDDHLGGHLPTHLKGLDAALRGGIPFGVVTELVGPAGIGKTQLCLKLALLASLPASHGGLDGHVIYMDVESKFSSRRLIEIGLKSYPDIFHQRGLAQEMAGRIIVLRPLSLSDFTEREEERGGQRARLLSWHISFIKSLAEFSRISVVVTNQVRSQSCDETCQYTFQGQQRGEITGGPCAYDSNLVAALGLNWAHAVTIRLVLEAKSGQRLLKVAKSPISPPLAFPFEITSAGISLLNDNGIHLKGPEINTIHGRGHTDIINFQGQGSL